jgi:hypothetical protein
MFIVYIINVFCKLLMYLFATQYNWQYTVAAFAQTVISKVKLK